MIGANNLIQSDGTWNYEYDAEGNRTKKTNIATGAVVEYQWDHHNRLVQVTERSSDQGPVTNVTDLLGLRDRAILETLYSTGMRRAEVVGLHLYDLDLQRGVVTIRQGKWKKDRVVPIGERAIAWNQQYLRSARPQLVVDPSETALYLTKFGTALSLGTLSELARDYVSRAEIGKKGACHIFRHSMATSMLENGADVRFIQAMLGHANLNTTQIYTQVAIKKLQQIHAATHPAEAKRRKAADDGEDNQSSDASAQQP